jgi:hypothetical protein
VAGSDSLLVSNANAPVQIRTGPGGDVYYLSYFRGTLHRVRRKG